MAIGDATKKFEQAKLHDQTFPMNLSNVQARAIWKAYQTQVVDKERANERTIIIGDKARQQLQGLFQTTISDDADLVEKVRRLCLVKIGDVEITFSQDELARMKMQAEFHGRSVEQFIREQVDEIHGRMLERV